MKKSKKKTKVRDMKPSKDAKGGGGFKVQGGTAVSGGSTVSGGPHGTMLQGGQTNN